MSLPPCPDRSCLARQWVLPASCLLIPAARLSLDNWRSNYNCRQVGFIISTLLNMHIKSESTPLTTSAHFGRPSDIRGFGSSVARSFVLLPKAKPAPGGCRGHAVLGRGAGALSLASQAKYCGCIKYFPSCRRTKETLHKLRQRAARTMRAWDELRALVQAFVCVLY